MSDDAFAAGFMDDYFAECDEHLAAVRRLLLELSAPDGSAPRAALIGDLFRSFHSIKGISGMVGLRDAEMLAHQLESYLRALRDGVTRLSETGVDALVAGVDVLERVIAARRQDRPGPAIDGAVRQLEDVSAPVPETQAVRPAAAETSEPAWRITFTPSLLRRR